MRLIFALPSPTHTPRARAMAPRCAALLLTMSVLANTGASAQMPPTATASEPTHTAAALVGSWQLQSVEMRHADGRISQPFGAQPQGLAIYQANGSMSITLQRAQRPTFAHAQLYAASTAEKASIAESFSAYAGRYVIEPASATVHHHIEVSSFPNWNNATQTRRYTLEGNTLTLSTTDTTAPTTVLIWRRVP